MPIIKTTISENRCASPKRAYLSNSGGITIYVRMHGATHLDVKLLILRQTGAIEQDFGCLCSRESKRGIPSIFYMAPIVKGQSRFATAIVLDHWPGGAAGGSAGCQVASVKPVKAQKDHKHKVDVP